MSATSQMASVRPSTGHEGAVSGAVGIIRTGGRPVKGTRLIRVWIAKMSAMRRAGR